MVLAVLLKSFSSILSLVNVVTPVAPLNPREIESEFVNLLLMYQYR